MNSNHTHILEVDFREASFSVAVREAHNTELNSQPVYMYHGFGTRFKLAGPPCNVEGLCEAVTAIVGEYRSASRWDGHNHVCSNREGQEEIHEEISEYLSSLSEENFLREWDAIDWLGDPPKELKASSTDEDIEALVASLETEASNEGVTVKGLKGYLEYSRDMLREESEAAE